MKRNLLTTIVVFLAISLTTAHEFWLQPKKFSYQVGEEMKVSFMVGENFTGEPWDLNRHRVKKLEVHSTGVVKNLLRNIKTAPGINLSYKFDKEGTHLLVLESDTAFIRLEGEKFNAYLKEDGIEDILDARTQSKDLAKPAREYYTRFAKLLLQSGFRKDDTFRKRIGFRYEIVPLQNPYSLKSGDYLDCRVLWEGKPVPHTLVKVWSIVGNKTFLQDVYTEDDGVVRFPISSAGAWMVSSVKMIAAQKEGADYESFWASLVFGIE